MTRPGERLRAIAQRLCSPRTMERLVDPIVADLQREHAEAIGRGWIWRAHWIRCAGVWGLAKAASLHAIRVSRRGRAIGHAFAAAAVIAAAQILMFLPTPASNVFLSRRDEWPVALLILFMLPSALAIAVPVAVAVGVLSREWDAPADRRARRRILAIALACSAFALLNNGWISPAANQRFRELVVGHPIPKGINELTIRELRQSLIAAPPGYDDNRKTLTAATWYHLRIAVSAAPMVLGLFALAAAAIERPRVRRLLAALTLTAFVGCYFLFPPHQVALLLRWLSPMAIAWMPNMLMIAATLITFPFRAWPRGISSHAS